MLEKDYLVIKNKDLARSANFLGIFSHFRGWFTRNLSENRRGAPGIFGVFTRRNYQRKYQKLAEIIILERVNARCHVFTGRFTLPATCVGTERPRFGVHRRASWRNHSTTFANMHLRKVPPKTNDFIHFQIISTFSDGNQRIYKEIMIRYSIFAT